MVGPLGDTVEFPVAPPVVLVPERDGVRVISDERHELLRRVPAPLADVYRVGSTTPGDNAGSHAFPDVLSCTGGCRQRKNFHGEMHLTCIYAAQRLQKYSGGQPPAGVACWLAAVLCQSLLPA